MLKDKLKDKINVYSQLLGIFFQHLLIGTITPVMRFDADNLLLIFDHLWKNPGEWLHASDLFYRADFIVRLYSC